MRTLIQDLHFGVRMLRKQPGFVVAIVLTLGLGIGAVTAIFYWLNAILFRPLPFPNSNELVLLSEVWKEKGWGRSSVSSATFSDWQEQSTSFQGLGAFSSSSFRMQLNSRTELLRGLEVSTGLFDVLGTRPLLGRTFLSEEGQRGRNNVIILSYEFWQREFDGRRELIGTSISIEGTPHVIVGIMPQRFQFPYDTEIWRPLASSSEDILHRDRRSLQVVGRLKQNVSLREAQTELGTITARIAREFPQTNHGWDCSVEPLRVLFIDIDLRKTLWILFAAAGFVLLTACANIANLLLARFGSRHKEIAIRSSLGAARSRIVRQLLTECLLLSLIGTGAGLLLSLWLSLLVKRLVPNLAGEAAPGFDWHMFLFSLGLCLASGVCFGTIPAWRLARAGPFEILKESSTSSTGSLGAHRLGMLWIVSEVTCAMILLAGAGVMIRTVVNMTRVNIGFDPAPLIVAEITPAWDPHEGNYSEKKVLYFQQLRDGLARANGLDGAAILVDSGWADFVAESKTDLMKAYGFGCSSNFFTTLETPLIQGHIFPDRWKKGDPVEAVINETFAQRFWPGESAVGKRFKPNTPGTAWVTVAGVVRNFKLARDQQARAQYYSSYRQAYLEGVQMIERSHGSMSEAVATVRQTIKHIDPNLSNSKVRLLSESLSEVIRPRIQLLRLMGGFATVALALAIVGIYGVLSYLVSQRRRELGIRIALGAKPVSLLLLTLRQGLIPVFIGLGCGSVGSVILGQFLASQLFGIRPADPIALAGSLILILAAAVVACYLPARQAARVDPMVVLRQE